MSAAHDNPSLYLPSAQRIKAAREAKDMTQATLGERCRVHQTQVAHWEVGRRTPRTIDWCLIAAALDANLDWLIRGVPTKGGTA